MESKEVKSEFIEALQNYLKDKSKQGFPILVDPCEELEFEQWQTVISISPKKVILMKTDLANQGKLLVADCRKEITREKFEEIIITDEESFNRLK